MGKRKGRLRCKCVITGGPDVVCDLHTRDSIVLLFEPLKKMYGNGSKIAVN